MGETRGPFRYFIVLKYDVADKENIEMVKCLYYEKVAIKKKNNILLCKSLKLLESGKPRK